MQILYLNSSDFGKCTSPEVFESRGAGLEWAHGLVHLKPSVKWTLESRASARRKKVWVGTAKADATTTNAFFTCSLKTHRTHNGASIRATIAVARSFEEAQEKAQGRCQWLPSTRRQDPTATSRGGTACEQEAEEGGAVHDEWRFGTGGC